MVLRKATQVNGLSCDGWWLLLTCDLFDGAEYI